MTKREAHIEAFKIVAHSINELLSTGVYNNDLRVVRAMENIQADLTETARFLNSQRAFYPCYFCGSFDDICVCLKDD
jgi:hypothetical protein